MSNTPPIQRSITYKAGIHQFTTYGDGSTVNTLEDLINLPPVNALSITNNTVTIPNKLYVNTDIITSNLTAVNVTITSNITISDATINIMTIDNATITNSISANNITIASNLTVDNATITNSISTNNIIIASNLTVDNATITNSISANNITIANNLTTNNITVASNLTANNAIISNSITANNAIVTSNLIANNATITSNITANNIRISSNITANTAIINNDLTTNNTIVNNKIISSNIGLYMYDYTNYPTTTFNNPVVAMTSYNLVVTDRAHVSGTYNVIATTEQNTFQAWKAFDLSSSTYWRSASGTYNYSTGAYLSTNETLYTKNGAIQSYPGEWIQIYMDLDVMNYGNYDLTKITGFTLTWSATTGVRGKSITIFSSTNGKNGWIAIYSNLTAYTVTTLTDTFTTTPIGKYFRLAFNTKNTSATVSHTYIEIASFTITAQFPAACVATKNHVILQKNVGIGNTNPTNALSVTGTVSATTVTATSASATDFYAGYLFGSLDWGYLYNIPYTFNRTYTFGPWNGQPQQFDVGANIDKNQTTYLRIQAWGPGGGGGSGSAQDANQVGGTTTTLTGGAGGGSGSYLDITFHVAPIRMIEVDVYEGGRRGESVFDYSYSGIYMPGNNGTAGTATAIRVYGNSIDGSITDLWSFSISVPGGGGGQGGANNIARTGGTAGGAVTFNPATMPTTNLLGFGSTVPNTYVTHVGLVGGGCTDYTATGTGAPNATIYRQSTSGGCGAGILNTGVSFIAGRNGGQLAIPTIVTAGTLAANRCAKGGLIDGSDGENGIYHTTGYIGASGGGGGASISITGSGGASGYAGVGGNGGFPGGGGGGGGAGKGAWGSGPGGHGGDGFVMLHWW